MAEPFWAAAGPSRSAAASFAAAPAPPTLVPKKKRGRTSDGKKAPSASIPSIVNPPSPELVPRHTSSASSWGIEDESDESDGDYDWPTVTATNLPPALANLQSPDLDRDELAKFARPSKRAHLETPEDRHTYGKMAGLQIDPTALGSSVPSQSSFGRPTGARANSGLAGAFGLSSSLASSLSANQGLGLAPRVPPSSPTKADAVSNVTDGSASTFYQQAVAPAPPTSPSRAVRGIVPPSSPIHVHGFETSAIPSKRANSADLEDSDMRLRRGGPTSFEVEKDRIVVTSLDDTSSSEAGGSSDAEGQRTPDADTSTESKDSASDFVINNELIEKLEAHSRAVLTGTSERDNAASSSSRSGSAGGSCRSRRSAGRRSGGGPGVPSIGSLLSSRRRSTASSPASSGYASPINAEDARGALILWKDPEEVLKSTSAAITAPSPLQQSELASVPEYQAGFMTGPPVVFQSGSLPPSNSGSGMPSPAFGNIPGMVALPTTPHDSVESPLYAQQSSLSSSYFPEPSPLETRFGHQQAFGSAMAPRSTEFAPVMHAGAANSAPYQPGAQHYGHHYGIAQQPQQQHMGLASFGVAAQQQHNLGAQPIDLSGHFGPVDEMEMD